MASSFGHCSLCPKNSPSVKLYGAGVCLYHLQHPGDNQSKQKVVLEVKKDLDAITLKKFFEDQVKLIPSRCENCGGPIRFTAAGKKAHVAHIIPKRHFKSVQAQPLNRWFGCIDCHTDYDNKGWSYAVTMAVWPKVVERFQAFMDKIKPGELKHLPAALADVLKAGK